MMMMVGDDDKTTSGFALATEVKLMTLVLLLDFY